MNYKADEFDYEAEYQRLRKGVARANILLLGASGAGKSSVINHVFGREMTQAGPGQSVTRGVIPCSSDDMPVVLYDTEGYTAGSAGMDAFERTVLAFADRLAAERPGDLSCRIHVAWFCISQAAKRVTDTDVRLVRALRERGIPVCLVLTHADAADAQELAAMQRTLTDRLPDVPQFLTCALPELQEPLRGLLQWDDLLSWSLDSLEPSLREGFISALHLELDRKKKLVMGSIVPRYTAGAAAVGAVPLSFSDAVLLVPLQTTMTLHILNVYGIEKISQPISGLVGSMLMTQVGKSTAAGLLKLIPGVGSLLGGAVTAAVAGTLTGALGYAICELSHLYAYKVLVEHENLSAIDWFDPKQVERLMREYISRQKKNRD